MSEQDTLASKGATSPWEYPKRPWSRMYVDYAGPYQGNMLLVTVDAFTIWLEVHVMNSCTAEATVEKLRTTFATFGIPETVVSDNGTCFASEVFQTFMSRIGIIHIKLHRNIQCQMDWLNVAYNPSKKVLTR